MPHQEIQKVRNIRIYMMYALSGNTIYVWKTIYAPHQKIQYIVRHIRKYKEYATSGNSGCTPYREILCISEELYIRHITKCYVCLKNNQEIQKVSHIRINRMYALSGNAIYVCRTNYTPQQKIKYIVRHIRKYKECATSGNTGCTRYREILYISEELYIRHITKCYVCLKNNMFATPGNKVCCTAQQEIQEVCHIRK